MFVAFELMSIPLYYLTGFLSGEEEAVEAALKFFLVGTVSSAVLVYGLSFVYGIAGTTDLGGIASALRTGHPLTPARHGAGAGGARVQVAAFPFHMWVPDAYEAASTPFVAWLSVAPKAAGFVVIFRLYLEGVASPAASGTQQHRAPHALQIQTEDHDKTRRLRRTDSQATNGVLAAS